MHDIPTQNKQVLKYVRWLHHVLPPGESRWVCTTRTIKVSVINIAGSHYMSVLEMRLGENVCYNSGDLHTATKGKRTFLAARDLTTA